jgi:hypothetical protein
VSASTQEWSRGLLGKKLYAAMKNKCVIVAIAACATRHIIASSAVQEWLASLAS